MDKYVIRGFHAVGRQDLIDIPWTSPGRRYIGDSKCWTIALCTEGLSPSCVYGGFPPNLDWLGINSWLTGHNHPCRVRLTRSTMDMPPFSLSYTVIGDCNLRYFYTLAPEDHQCVQRFLNRGKLSYRCSA